MKTLSHFGSAAILAAMIGLLAGCGAKGPLFLPEKPLQEAPPADDSAPGEDAPDAPMQPEDEPPQEDPATPTDGNG